MATKKDIKIYKDIMKEIKNPKEVIKGSISFKVKSSMELQMSIFFVYTIVFIVILLAIYISSEKGWNKYALAACIIGYIIYFIIIHKISNKEDKKKQQQIVDKNNTVRISNVISRNAKTLNIGEEELVIKLLLYAGPPKWWRCLYWVVTIVVTALMVIKSPCPEKLTDSNWRLALISILVVGNLMISTSLSELERTGKALWGFTDYAKKRYDSTLYNNQMHTKSDDSEQGGADK